MVVGVDDGEVFVIHAPRLSRDSVVRLLRGLVRQASDRVLSLCARGTILPRHYRWVTRMASIPYRTAFLVAMFAAWPVARTYADDQNDYPTATRAEYVFACMATNGQTQDALRRCACSIDAIASILPYEKYQDAETVLRMRRSAGGYLGEVFRSGLSNTMMRDLQEAQAEAEIRCF